MGPNRRQHEARAHPVRANLNSTVQESFQLKGAQQQKAYQTAAEQRCAQKVKEECLKRHIEATKLNVKILKRPKLVPELQEALKKPVVKIQETHKAVGTVIEAQSSMDENSEAENSVQYPWTSV